MFKKIPNPILISLGSIILFFPFLGSTHLFDWDEVNFAEVSREMLVTKNFLIPQINFEPFWEKPLLFFWLQTASMYFFGVNEFASRFPNAVCGLVTLLVLYRIGRQLVDKHFGLIWVLIYAGSLLPQLYFKSAIIDPWFNLFIFLSLYHLMFYSDEKNSKNTKHVLLSSLFAGLAVLTKGPVALLLIGLCYGIFQLVTGFKSFMRVKHLFVYLLITFLVGSVWFLALLINGHEKVIADFINYQISLFATNDADQNGPFFYHVIVLLVGCFPATALGLLAMLKFRRITLSKNFHVWMMILFWVVLIIFSIVKTKIVHYSSLCYFPLTFYAALSFYNLYKGNWILPAWNKWLQFATGLLLALLIIGITYVDQWGKWMVSSNLVKDAYAREALQASVRWTGFEKIPGFLLLGGTLLFLYYARTKTRLALVVLFASSMVAINLMVLLITPKIEPYSQGAAIEFYQTKAPENAILETIGFKSYAQLFYGRRPAYLGKSVADSIFSFNTHPQVPVYLVGKIQNKEKDKKENTHLVELYSKNGFVFYKFVRK